MTTSQTNFNNPLSIRQAKTRIAADLKAGKISAKEAQMKIARLTAREKQLKRK